MLRISDLGRGQHSPYLPSSDFCIELHAQAMDEVTSKVQRSRAKTVKKGERSTLSGRQTREQQAIEEQQVEEADNLAEASSRKASKPSSPQIKASKKTRQSKKSPLTELKQTEKDASGLRSGK
jgi:hypothetical protein